jgi:NTE family protein
VPVSVLKGMGADFIIAVNVIPNFKARMQQVEKLQRPNVFNILMQSIYIGTYLLVGSSLRGADIAIEPRVAHIGAGDFHRARECISQGRLAAEAVIPRIRERLEV